MKLDSAELKPQEVRKFLNQEYKHQTVPAIFIDGVLFLLWGARKQCNTNNKWGFHTGKFIGGRDSLYALEEQGKLKNMLNKQW